MRSLKKILDQKDEAPPFEAAAPEISPPVIEAERAEERIFEEAKKKDEIISGVRSHLLDKK